MIKEIGFVTPVFLSGLIGRPITTWQGAAVAEERGLRLVVPLSATDTCVPWHNVAWWTEAPGSKVPLTYSQLAETARALSVVDAPAQIDVTEQANTPAVVVGDSVPANREASPTGITPAPGKGKKR